MKEYQTVEFNIGSTLDNAVRFLENLNNKGILAKGKFNGHFLYSDTVSLDSAYKEITGLSYDAFKKQEIERQNEYEDHKKKHLEAIPQLTDEWINKGHEVLTVDKWKDWDECVPIRLNDLYEGMELGCTLDIIKQLNDNSPFDKIKIMLDNQGHSGMSYSLVCYMVKCFHNKGKEFIDYINNKEKGELK